MPHGYPDYGRDTTKETVYALQDHAELAARLGSILTFHRSGDLLAYDDFASHRGHTELVANGAAGLVDITSKYWRSHGFALSMVTGTGESNTAYARLWAPLPSLLPVGFEYSFTYTSEPAFILNDIRVRSPTYDIYGGVRYNTVTDELQVYVAGVGYVPFATGVRVDYIIWLWNTWKLVMDLTTGRYVYLKLNNRLYDLRAYAFTLLDLATTQRIGGHAENQGKGELSHTMYADDFILTQNQP